MPTLLAMLLLSSLAPADGGYTRDQLQLLATTAAQEFSRMESRCSTPTQPSDLAAELAFRRSADLMEIVVQHETYPTGRPGQSLRSDDVGAVAQSLERAYLCNPGWEQRHYLERAIKLLEERLAQIRDQERRPPSDPDSASLQQVRERLLALTLALTQPPPCKTTTCPKGPVAPASDEPDTPPPPPYRTKYMDLFSLRLELGAGLNTRFKDDQAMLAEDRLTEYNNGFIYGFAPGVRFLLGRNKRHVLATGFRWSVLTFKDDDKKHNVHQIVARFEYGLRLHERWFSLHAAFEPGTQARARDPRFGTAQIGGSGAICTGDEIFCLRFGGYSGTLGGEWGLIGMFLNAGIDVFRVTDNILRRAER